MDTQYTWGEWIRVNRLWVLGALIIIVLLVGGLIFVKQQSQTSFEKVYSLYIDASKRHADAAFLPSSEENPVREETNRMLREVLLREDLTNAERKNMAERGIALLEVLEKQIDEMGTVRGEVEEALEKMEAFPEGRWIFAHKHDAEALASFAHTRLALIADIRGLSYRANFHTAEIFERIVKEGGALTNEHKIALNSQIPRVEEQFDERAELYKELEKTNFQVETLIGRLEGTLE